MRPFDKTFRRGLHRSRNGLILGVCKGIADYFDFSVFWVRGIVVICLILSGFWPITGLYFLAALLMKPEPVIPIHSEGEQEFYDSYVSSRRGAVDVDLNPVRSIPFPGIAKLRGKLEEAGFPAAEQDNPLANLVISHGVVRPGRR